jgi:hypothetical protein
LTASRAIIWSLTVGAVALVGVLSVGCGGNSRADNSAPAISPAFAKVVTDLKAAALSSRPYDAARHTKRLSKPERAVIEGFCTFAWQIPVNHLDYLLGGNPYPVNRVTHLAELSYRGGAVGYDVSDASVEASLGRLRRIVHLRSLDGRLVRKYSRACSPSHS